MRSIHVLKGNTDRRGRRPLPWIGGIDVSFAGEFIERPAPAVFDERFFSYIMDRRGRRSLPWGGGNPHLRRGGACSSRASALPFLLPSPNQKTRPREIPVVSSFFCHEESRDVEFMNYSFTTLPVLALMVVI